MVFKGELLIRKKYKNFKQTDTASRNYSFRPLVTAKFDETSEVERNRVAKFQRKIFPAKYHAKSG